MRAREYSLLEEDGAWRICMVLCLNHGGQRMPPDLEVPSGIDHEQAGIGGLDNHFPVGENLHFHVAVGSLQC